MLYVPFSLSFRGILETGVIGGKYQPFPACSRVLMRVTVQIFQEVNLGFIAIHVPFFHYLTSAKTLLHNYFSFVI